MPDAIIFGCGPAGLFAAYACDQAGYDVRIFSRKQRSTLYGAQFLSVPPPAGLPAVFLDIDVTLRGTEAEYREKVYGPDYDGDVSPGKYIGRRRVWDIRIVYDLLYDFYESQIYDASFTARTFGPITRAHAQEGALVISSLPLIDMCSGDDHAFEYARIFASGDAPDLGIRCPVRIAENNVVYCGDDTASWYRASHIFGHCTVEWPAQKGQKKPPVTSVVGVVKPTRTTCTCYPDVVRVGRYGEWRKGVLAHDAYTKTVDVLTKRGIQGVLF